MKMFGIKSKAAGKALTVLLCAGILLGMSGCGRITDKKIDELEDDGYFVEQIDNNSICITEDGIEYYFKTGLFKPVLDKAVVTMPSQNERLREEGYEIRITITKKSNNRMELLYEKPAVDTYSTGEENIVTVCYHFEFKNDFALESLTNNRGFDDIAGDYQACWNFLSAEEVQRIYDRGLEIEAGL